MKKKVLVLATLVIAMATTVKAQLNVGSTTAPSANAALQISSTNQGVRLPNVALTTTTTFGLATAPTSADSGMTVYNTNQALTSSSATFPSTGKGVYYWDGFGWVSMNASSAISTAAGAQDLSYLGSFNHVTKDAGVGGTGTSLGSGTDNIAIGTSSLFRITAGNDNLAIGANTLGFTTSGSQNLGIGGGALSANTTHSFNTAIGYGSLTHADAAGNTALGYSALTTNTTGANNVAIGYNAAIANTAASDLIAIGHNTLGATTINGNNIAIGSNAMGAATGTLNSGVNNVAIGYGTLNANTGNATVNTGSSNVAVGNAALNSNTTGLGNVGLGSNALQANTIADNNTAVGQNAMGLTTTGVQNTSIGFLSLYNNTIGGFNSGLGVAAGSSITTGSYNTAVGYGSMSLSGSNITGSYNTATGIASQQTLTSGLRNSSFGTYSLHDNSTGNSNTALGYEAYYHGTGSNNVAVGFDAGSNIVAGDNNVAIGWVSLATQTSGSNNIAVGYGAIVPNGTGSNQLSIGNTIYGNSLGNGLAKIGVNIPNPYTTLHVAADEAGYSGQIIAGGVTNPNQITELGYNTSTNLGFLQSSISGSGWKDFVINPNSGNLGVGMAPSASYKLDVNGLIRSTGALVVSDKRLKRNIVPVANALADVMKLKAVSYEKKSTMASSDYKVKEIGFIAQDVRKVFPTLVVDDQGADKLLAVNYTAIIPVLTKAIQEQQAEIADLKKQNAAITAQLNKVADLQTAMAELRNQLNKVVATKTASSNVASK